MANRPECLMKSNARSLKLAATLAVFAVAAAGLNRVASRCTGLGSKALAERSRPLA